MLSLQVLELHASILQYWTLRRNRQGWSAGKFPKNEKSPARTIVLTGPYPVGETGFEPATPASRTQCSARLSYSPIPAADGVGFEPTRAFTPHDFQSCALSRSATRPSSGRPARPARGFGVPPTRSSGPPRPVRRGRDSNPREPFGPNALAGRRLKPLGHLSSAANGRGPGSPHGTRRSPPRSHCPSWDRTRTLLIQSQACCQLHQGASSLVNHRDPSASSDGPGAHLEAGDGARTRDPQLGKLMLCQLSYSRTSEPPVGLEPTTPSLRMMCSTD